MDTEFSDTRHSFFDDAQGLLVGTLLVALSVQLLGSAMLTTGQIAGLSLVLSYASGLRFGLLFFVLNLPFYWLAFRRMGTAFTLKTFAAVGLLSLFTELLPNLLIFQTVHPLAGAILAGVAAGAGLLVLFRHGASLGGIGIVAFWMQETRRIRAGWVQLGFDAFVFALALWVMDPVTVLYSLAGAMVTNIIIATNHRRDRYIAR
ncbi:putative 5xTM membrane YitT family protein [Rhodovulum imhoffii]|uniref:Putative 5xTM membrane YitT family protein n=1 Tax=Rhodovulum imhoffii TaxID=365340 RepID=A0A2T5BV94_9RHOB|nr:YitT family protein [Rhodovulum imhoffii]MBK5934254.1 membrane protein [Rhodovulum imhoffii]PTN03499.1 putative 5xTM membrane YitT family protein [Rhodovulum imhoffii]